MSTGDNPPPPERAAGSPVDHSGTENPLPFLPSPAAGAGAGAVLGGRAPLSPIKANQLPHGRNNDSPKHDSNSNSNSEHEDDDKDQDEDDVDVDEESQSDCEDEDDKEDDDEGEEDEEEGEIFDLIHPSLRLGIGGDDAARRVAKPILQRTTKPLVDYFEDPDGYFSQQLTARDPGKTERAAYYAELKKKKKKKGTRRIKKKIGSSGQTGLRPDFYAKDHPDSELVRFTVMLKMDMLDEKADAELQKLYKELMEALITDPSIHPFQRHLFKTIRDRRGWCLGVKDDIVLQMIESGYQLEKNLSSPQEFLMKVEPVCGNMFALTNTYSDAIQEQMPQRILDNAGDDVFLFAVASWATAYTDALSSKIETTKCLVGDNWIDTLPFPAVPNATNVEEGFSTKEYTAAQKKEARKVVIKWLRELLKQVFGVLFLNTNKLIFDNDRNFAKPVDYILRRLGFKKKLTLLYNQIIMYVHADKHVVFVHCPLCRASDPQTHVTEDERTLCGLVVAVLGNISRAVRGKERYTAQDVIQNPIYAMLAYKVVGQGFHQSNLACAAFYRDFISPEETNALTQNNLGKSDMPAVSKRVKKQREKEDCSRPVTSDLTLRARSLISKVTEPSPEQLQWLHDSLCQLFSTGKRGERLDSSGLSTRWHALKKNCLEGSELLEHITAMRTETTQNSGNQTRGPGKAVTNEEHDSNDVFMEELVQKHKPAPTEEFGKFFWITDKRDNTKTPPETGTKCVCRHETFTTGEHPVYFQLGLDGIKSRCESKPSKRPTKKNTNHKISKKYPHLKVIRQLTRKDNNSGIRVKNAAGETFHLVAFGHTQDGSDAKKPAAKKAAGKRKHS